jgi:hypothetical protein
MMAGIVDESTGPVSTASTMQVDSSYPARQALISQWVRRVIGDEALSNPQERGLRVAEEAIELAQAMRVSAVDLHRLVDYVYARPVGTPGQEIAGTLVTLYAAATCAGVDADYEFAVEVARIHTPEIEAKVRRRQIEKRERMVAKVGA